MTCFSPFPGIMRAQTGLRLFTKEATFLRLDTTVLDDAPSS